MSQRPALLLSANHVKEQKFYIGTNLHVLCIPIQNQESAQSNMIYSCGLRSIIDLKEGRKTTWCTISFSSKPAWSLQPKKHRQLAHDHSAILSLFCSGRLSWSVRSNWLGQFSWWRLTQTVHLPTDGFSWMRIDRTHCTSKTGRFRDRGTETQNFTFVICTLYCGSMCAGWPAPLTGRVQDRSAPWPAGCKIAVRRDYAVLQSCWLWHSRIVRSFSDMCR